MLEVKPKVSEEVEATPGLVVVIHWWNHQCPLWHHKSLIFRAAYILKNGEKFSDQLESQIFVRRMKKKGWIEHIKKTFYFLSTVVSFIHMCSVSFYSSTWFTFVSPLTCAHVSAVQIPRDDCLCHFWLWSFMLQGVTLSHVQTLNCFQGRGRWIRGDRSTERDLCPGP